jgi:polyisoprenyl-teichoic acid--peptidoglycan teichoic acid transferase
MKKLHKQTPVRKRAIAFVLIAGIALFGFLFLKGISYVPVLFDLLFKKEITLKKNDNRINVLLLGIGGGKHDGPLLTDTIIFASLDPEKNTATLVSLPRDLWIPDMEAKINTAYAFAEGKQKGGGLLLTKALVGKILGEEIDYAVRVDFNGFIKAVDMVGGIDVQVDRVLDDPEYPLSGKETDTCGFEGEEFEKRATEASQLDAFPCRYETLHFEPGLQHMNGEQALKFVRSRHAKGEEGTDFARSKRQEKVILAFKETILSAQTFLNPIKLVSLLDIFKDSIDTDIQKNEFDDFIKLARKMEHAQIRSSVLDYGDEEQDRKGLLVNPEVTDEYNYQWVIIPRVGNGNYAEIHTFVDCQITYGNCDITEDAVTPSQTVR